MKQSILSIALFCLVLCGAFSLMAPNEKVQKKSPSYCCMKTCKPAANKLKTATEVDSYIPMVNIWGFN